MTSKETFHQRLDRIERENRIKRIYANRPENLHDYQGCANDLAMQNAAESLPGQKIESSQNTRERCQWSQLGVGQCRLARGHGDHHDYGPEPVESIPVEKERRLVPVEIAHALWCEGGRLRSDLSASLTMNPENWHEEGLRQRLDKWDAAAERYFDVAISAEPKPTLSTPSDLDLLNKPSDSIKYPSSTAVEEKAAPSGEEETGLVYVDPRTKEPCRRCYGKGFMPPWPDSNGLVVCGVCRAEERPKPQPDSSSTPEQTFEGWLDEAVKAAAQLVDALEDSGEGEASTISTLADKVHIRLLQMVAAKGSR